MDFESVLPYLFFVAGVSGRVFIPYILAYLQDSKPFDTKYAIGQVLAAFIALITMWAADASGIIDSIGAMGYAAAFAYGWFSADVGREIQKTRKTTS